MDFKNELDGYLRTLGNIPEDIAVVPVPLSFFSGGAAGVDAAAMSLLDLRRKNSAEGIRETLFIYEDRWFHDGPQVRDRLKSHLGKGHTVFARNCEVREITQEKASAFLNRHHSYGATRTPFRFGLFRIRATGSGESGMADSPVMIAVGTFSKNNEWERYASLPRFRVAGGMGKILSAFTQAVRPAQVMSYADLEWSDGEVYRRLGFKMEKPGPPVHFLVNPGTYQRVHLQKFASDKKFRNMDCGDWIEIANPGSAKALLDIKQF